MNWLKNNKWIALLGFVFLISLCLILYGVLSIRSNQILKGVKLAEIDLSGMTRKEATQVIEDYSQKKKQDSIRFKSDVTSFNYTFDELGFTMDAQKIAEDAFRVGRDEEDLNNIAKVINILFSPETIDASSNFDSKKLKEISKQLEGKVNRESRDASLEKDEENNISFLSDRPGAELNIEKTENIIRNLTGREEVVQLPVKEIQAKVKKKDLAFINGVLGTFSTEYSKSEKNRKHNIALGANYFNGMTLKPDQEVSFLKTINGITVENGFKESGVIIDGEFDRGTGGGICQVSTTLYNALIRGDVEIIERHNHSRPIGYVPRGTDAAVVDGGKDLVFKNNFKSPIYIVATTDGYDMDFTIYGNIDEKPYTIEIVPEALGTIYPRVRKQSTSSMYKGQEKVLKKGGRGFSYRTWRVKKVEDKEVERTLLSKSYYVPQDKVILVGTKERASIPKSESGQSSNYFQN